MVLLELDDRLENASEFPNSRNSQSEMSSDGDFLRKVDVASSFFFLHNYSSTVHDCRGFSPTFTIRIRDEEKKVCDVQRRLGDP